MQAHALSASALLVSLLAGPVSAQLPGIVDHDPVPPAGVTWAQLFDTANTTGTLGAEFADFGADRGVAWVDVVGPHPDDRSAQTR